MSEQGVTHVAELCNLAMRRREREARGRREIEWRDGDDDRGGSPEGDQPLAPNENREKGRVGREKAIGGRGGLRGNYPL